MSTGTSWPSGVPPSPLGPGATLNGTPLAMSPICTKGGSTTSPPLLTRLPTTRRACIGPSPPWPQSLMPCRGARLAPGGWHIRCSLRRPSGSPGEAGGGALVRVRPAPSPLLTPALMCILHLHCGRLGRTASLPGAPSPSGISP